MKKTVLILLSDKRSGSTMFQNALCRHSMIQTVAYSPHTYLETHHWLKGAVILNPDKDIYKGYGSVANARVYMLDLLKKNLPHWSPPTPDRSLITDGWDALCERFAQPVFFEKSPQFLGHPECLDLIRNWIRQTDYTVRIVGLTRNPLSVQYSAWQLFHTPPEKRQYGWARTQQNLVDFASGLSADQYLHVKYEDLIDDPEASFRQICKFIGVPYEEDITSRLHSQSLTKWKDDPYFTLRLDEKVKAVARKFGYTEEDLDNPEKPESPLSWKLKKKLVASYKLNRAKLKDRVLKPFILRVTGRE